MSLIAISGTPVGGCGCGSRAPMAAVAPNGTSPSRTPYYVAGGLALLVVGWAIWGGRRRR